MELSDLYSQRILEIAANQPVPGRLAAPDATALVPGVDGRVLDLALGRVGRVRQLQMADDLALMRARDLLPLVQNIPE